MSQETPKTSQPGSFTIGMDKALYWVSRHWLAVLNTLVALYVGLPILAPILMNAGLTGPGRAIYTLYSPMCHQMASRSFFLFGEQYAYPRELAGTNLTPIEAYMPELPEFDGVPLAAEDWVYFIGPARSFVGNAQMGYKMALCERDIGIYSFVLIGGLLYGLLRRYRRIRPMPLWLFLVVGLGPIALDGFSQLFSQYGAALTALSVLNEVFPLRESSPLLRTLTGALFGLSLVWLTYPRLDGGMEDTAQGVYGRLRHYGVYE